MKWINVKDELPKHIGSVLIYTEEGGVAEGVYTDKWLQFRWSVKDAKVTHWTELPQPPETK